MDMLLEHPFDAKGMYIVSLTLLDKALKKSTLNLDVKRIQKDRFDRKSQAQRTVEARAARKRTFDDFLAANASLVE